MAFDLSTARVRIGLTATDASQDAKLTIGMNAVLAIAENYCDRKFAYKRSKGEFILTSSRKLQVDRYPVDQIVSMTLPSGSAVLHTDYELHNVAGLVALTGSGYHSYKSLQIEWDGGYKTFPADLELALWGIFDAIWPSMSGSGGGTVAAGEIQSITVPDVGTVRFTTSGDSSTGSAGSGQYAVYGSFFHLLDKYRLVQS